MNIRVLGLLIFIIGSCVGSFLSVLVSRLDRHKGIINGRSECPRCHSIIKWYDLVPLISFVLLKAKCRHCQNPISLIYPYIELISGLTFLAIFINSYYLGWIYLVLVMAIASLLISIVFFDYLYFIIPDKIIITLLFLSLILNLQFNKENFLSAFITGLCISAIFGIMYLISHGTWIGLGDIKLIFIIGFLLGYPNGFIAIVGSVWLAAFVGLGLILAKRATAKTAIPFGLFIAIVSLFILIYQNEIQKIASRYFL